jgi:hypothetical protein
MATATAPVLGAISLTGSTPSPDSAPTSYILQTAQGAVPLTSSVTINSTLALDFDRTKINIGTGGFSLILLNSQVASFTAGLASAKATVDAELSRAVTTIPPAPATTPAPTPKPATQPANTNITTTTNTTANSSTATQPVENPSPEPVDAEAAIAQGGDASNNVENPSPEPVDAEAAIAQGGDASNNVENPSAPSSTGSSRGLQGAIDKTQASGTEEATVSAYRRNGDWRVRLSLAPESNYLYNSSAPQGLLAPLKATNGVIFPYTPAITTSYVANYDQLALTHSNYKVVQYSSSGVDSVGITADFTAQDTAEANYLLAVIHFFRTVTKMFYGQDSNPKNGTPPPLCFLTGLGNYQFDNHPLVLNSFSYSLPNDVDYIKATISDASIGKSASNTSMSRLPDNVRPGGQPRAANFNQNNGTNSGVTYVPTKIQLIISAYPVVSRNAVSNEFSLQRYATGALLQGSINSSGGGFW